ncbi:MAG: CHCH domain-containing [Lasallia pustulata]|uniref:CHCH domain-containing n=1 Tax=Lasallia pustulata TaxID=136370 RepID=A0A5M8PT83_9LECA|nr:MAG: CHCH domain-containing [Lasallia pustulata]
MSTSNQKLKNLPTEDDDEPDEWDKRIFSTGCAAEQTKMNDCYFEKKDWRLCKQEMENFRECWKRRGNDQRTETKDA